MCPRLSRKESYSTSRENDQSARISNTNMFIPLCPEAKRWPFSNIELSLLLSWRPFVYEHERETPKSVSLRCIIPFPALNFMSPRPGFNRSLLAGNPPSDASRPEVSTCLIHQISSRRVTCIPLRTRGARSALCQSVLLVVVSNNEI